MKILSLIIVIFLLSTSLFCQEKSGLLVEKNLFKNITILGIATLSAIATHEAGHYLVIISQGKKADISFGECNYKGNDNYMVDIGGVIATQGTYYLTRNSDNEFIKTYSEICRADLFYQVGKVAINNKEADLKDGKWIPFAVLGAVNLYEDRDWKITPLSISLKW